MVREFDSRWVERLEWRGPGHSPQGVQPALKWCDPNRISVIMRIVQSNLSFAHGTSHLLTRNMAGMRRKSTVLQDLSMLSRKRAHDVAGRCTG